MAMLRLSTTTPATGGGRGTIQRPWRRCRCLPPAAAGSSSSTSSGDAGQTPGSSSSSSSSSSNSSSNSNANSSGSNSSSNSNANSSSSSSSGGGGTSAYSQSPWELMGRVVSEHRIALQFDRQLNQGLIRSAAARESGLEFEEFEERLQRLLTLMPFLQERLVRMSPKLVAALAADPSLMAARLVELKSLLPAGDVAAIVGGRPSLLLPPEWERVPAAVAQLARHYEEGEVARLAAAEPLLLAEDVEQVLGELQRLAGAGGDARSMLLRNPALVYTVQRGTRSLGPGAEFL